MSEVTSVVVGVGRGEYDGGAGVAAAGPLEGAPAVVPVGAPFEGTGFVATAVGAPLTAFGGASLAGVALLAVGETSSTGAGSASPRLTAYAMPRAARRSPATASAALAGVNCGIVSSE
jgi:hypothetical protein